MSQVYDFLNESRIFYMSTINGDSPATRPFGAVMEHDGYLYFSTANTKEVYAQIKNNPHIQIVALRDGTREWIRVTGKALETTDCSIKQLMLDVCPVLQNRFVADSENYALFQIVELVADLMTDSGSTQIARY